VHPVAAGSCLAALRAGTARHHEEVERVFDMQRLNLPEHHRRVMQAMLDFHADWESPMLAAHSREDRIFLTQGSRWPLLLQDARDLHLRVPPAAGHGSCREWLVRADQAWGSAYVVWGSMLGGLVICKQMAPASDAQTLQEAPAGWRYFKGHGALTAPLWKEFLQRLDARAQGPEFCIDACVQSAQRTFDCMANCVQQQAA
jgi:heme oxygenase